MKTIYTNILKAVAKEEKQLAVLIDPDKMDIASVPVFMQKLNTSIATLIFVGGSEVAEKQTGILVAEIKKHTALPVILFPGDTTQITSKADGLLFLSLISGRNPDYLIGKQVAAVPVIKKTHLEIMSTGYVLIENGKKTAVQRVTETQPMSRENNKSIVDTAVAGEWLGMKLIYLEAGSGAVEPIAASIISAVKQEITIPLIVGGGIRSRSQMNDAFQAGADIVVIGTAFEEDTTFFNKLKK